MSQRVVADTPSMAGPTGVRTLSLILFALTIGALAGCEPNGDGRVAATFSVPECPPGDRLSALEGYGWDAGYLATERYFEVLIVQIQEFNVDIFETDSLGIRLDLEGLEQAGRIEADPEFYRPTSLPLVVPVGDARDQAQVVLSLFRTCERFPGFSAVAGRVVFDAFQVRVDGADTGEREQLVGRVETATLSYARAPAPVGTVEASFDFMPPRRPLREFE